MRETQHPLSLGIYDDFSFSHCDLCVALRSHVRPLTPHPSSHITGDVDKVIWDPKASNLEIEWSGLICGEGDELYHSGKYFSF